MYLRLFPLPLLALLAVGCGEPPGHDHGGEPGTPAAAATDSHAGHDHGTGITLPDSVQKNLGITWASVEYRVVQGVMRMPGRFESEAGARRIYAAPVAGQIDVLVKPFQRVAAGDALYRLHAEDWQRLQVAIAEGCNDGCGGECGSVSTAARALAAGERHADAVGQALRVWSARVETLTVLDRQVGGKAAELAEAATRVADLTIQSAEADRTLIRLRRDAEGLAALRLRQLMAQAAAMTGLSVERLEALDSTGRPTWMSLEALVVHAASAGVVEGEILPSGTWIDARTTVLAITDPTEVRLRAAGLQADLPRLVDGMRAHIIATDPAVPGSVLATVVLGPVADAKDRSVDLIARPERGAALPAWVRPGVTANLDVVLSGNAEEELAIPVAATIRDGLKTILFRRDPEHPDQVTKVDADLGASDGRWVVVQSGLKEGDQVVLSGIYPLKLSQQAGGTQAGHFDPDGTFHTGSH